MGFLKIKMSVCGDDLKLGADLDEKQSECTSSHSSQDGEVSWGILKSSSVVHDSGIGSQTQMFCSTGFRKDGDNGRQPQTSDSGMSKDNMVADDQVMTGPSHSDDVKDYRPDRGMSQIVTNGLDAKTPVEWPSRVIGLQPGKDLEPMGPDVRPKSVSFPELSSDYARDVPTGKGASGGGSRHFDAGTNVLQGRPTRSGADGRGPRAPGMGAKENNIFQRRGRPSWEGALETDRVPRYGKGHAYPRSGLNDLVNRQVSPIVTATDGMSFNTSVGNINSPNIKQKKAATYDGSGSWQDYLVQFEMISHLNGWGDDVKALELAINLRGLAQEVLGDLEPSERQNYHCLTTALAARFEPENQAELFRAQLKNRIRRRDENLPDLAQDMKRLVRKSYPTATAGIRAKLAMDGFIDALNDTELEWAVFQGKPNSIEDAVKLALEFEAFQTGRRKRLGNSPALRACETSIPQNQDMNSILKQIETLLSKYKLSSQNTVRRNEGQRRTPNQGRECFHCGEVGHFKRDCPKRGQAVSKGNNLESTRPSGNK